MMIFVRCTGCGQKFQSENDLALKKWAGHTQACKDYRKKEDGKIKKKEEFKR